SEFADLFGKDKFFLELQDHNLKEQKKVNKELITMAAQLNVGLIATNDAHYLNKEDAYYHDVLLCIQTGKSLNDQKRMRFPNAEFYLKTPQQMETIFEDYPDALYNTVKIAEMIDCQIPLGNAILPNFEVPEGYTRDSYLTELVNTGAQKRFGAIVPDHVKHRIEYELSVIQRMQFSGYFLVVWDFIQFAKKHGIPVGPGRGSAAGSMVSYCLEITELDPMKYNLLFERFLNPERNEMPDMDIDFCALRRDEVIDYVKQKYGEDHVSQIITFNKMKSKGAIRDVARALEIPLQQVNALTKLIRHEDLEEALQASDELKQLCKTNDTGKQLITIAKKVEGLTRSAGKHAAGVVISREPLMEHVPLYRDPKDGSISSQYEKVSLEKAGLVKMDFLGLANLTIIDTCIKLIKKHKNIAIDIAAIPLDDAKTFKLLQKADTMGVFQLESSGMQNILLKLGPTNFDDIIAIVALYRPGPLDSGMVEEFIERKRNPKKVEYLHPLLEPILKDTMGVIVYQEQV
ncbi:MAG TPA: DNA polymerase III subunit alpha, partial [Spirochaetota bacterium]|nr:DNA polymerase III subunit alpha [Spirochaetota bacterium]